MRTITLHNGSDHQLKLIEALLNELKIKFEVSKEEEIIKLTDAERDSIQKGLQDLKDGHVLSSEEAKERAEKCFR